MTEHSTHRIEEECRASQEFSALRRREQLEEQRERLASRVDLYVAVAALVVVVAFILVVNLGAR